MPSKRHKQSKRPSVSQKARTEGRSQRSGTQRTHMSAEEMQQRAEAYARMYRGDGQQQVPSTHVSQVGNTSQTSQELPRTSVGKRASVKDKDKSSVHKRPKVRVPRIQAEKQPREAKELVQDGKESVANDIGSVLRTEEAARDTDSHTDGNDKSKPKTRTSRKRAKLSSESSAKPKRFKPLFIVLGILAGILFVVTLVLAWNTWLRFDDSADIQGSWYVEGTNQSITITDSQIVLTDSVAYNYTLDTFNKTITFTFSNLQGSGSYAFSPERDTLVITEDDSSAEGGSVPTTLVRNPNQQSSQEEAQQQMGDQQGEQASSDQAGNASSTGSA